jgi:EAL domain-containing protein (putative c-di-GMP-specific phosphodiesterase class I)
VGADDGVPAVRVLTSIAASGIRLALDDFGTGYSSLSYLRTYPIHIVKIDRSFIEGLPTDIASCRLVESIVGMSAALGKHVVAEGVETEGQLAFLDAAGCSGIQGYLLGRPMEAGDIPGFLQRLNSGMPREQAPAAGESSLRHASGI